MNTERYIGTVVEDENGEMLLELPVELLKQMGWDEGTLLQWMIDEEQITLKEAKHGGDNKTTSV